MLLPRESVMVAFPDATLAVAESDTADRVFALMFSNDALSPTDPNDMVWSWRAGNDERTFVEVFFFYFAQQILLSYACLQGDKRTSALFECAF